MDVSLSHHKPRCLKTGGIPSIISLNPCGDHLAVGCTNGDICFWWLPLDDDTTPTHRVLINLPQNGIEVSSILWVSDTLVTLGRKNGLMTIVNIDYSRRFLSVGNFAADDARQAIRCISYHDELRCVATATRDNISIWEFDEYEWELWKKVQTFPAHTGPVFSNEEENAIEITSVHWLKKHRGIKGALLVSFLHHGVRVIDVASEQVVRHLPVRTRVGSLSLSADETMIVVNNAYNGFLLYDVPRGPILQVFIERHLCDTSCSAFMGSDRFLVYPGDNGVLKVWDVYSKASTGTVYDGRSSEILAVDARSCKGFDGHSVLVTLARDRSSPDQKYITVWESLRKDELLAYQIPSDYSTAASWVVISAVAAAWFLAPRSLSML